jgi:hypothetical protein
MKCPACDGDHQGGANLLGYHCGLELALLKSHPTRDYSVLKTCGKMMKAGDIVTVNGTSWKGCPFCGEQSMSGLRFGCGFSGVWEDLDKNEIKLKSPCKRRARLLPDLVAVTTDCSKQGTTTPAERHACTCDFWTVIYPKGCQCGGR